MDSDIVKIMRGTELNSGRGIDLVSLLMNKIESIHTELHSIKTFIANFNLKLDSCTSMLANSNMKRVISQLKNDSLQQSHTLHENIQHTRYNSIIIYNVPYFLEKNIMDLINNIFTPVDLTLKNLWLLSHSS